MLRRRVFSLRPVFFLASLLLISGCASNKTGLPNQLALRGNLHGGQQPVSGSSVQLYAVGLSGSGTTSTALLNAPAITDANGNFTITGTYTCPTAGSQVYIVARGGNPGLAAGTNNSNIAMASPLGPCGNLTASTFIQINELTTAALAAAVEPFAGSSLSIGSSATDAPLLNAAFAMANRYVSTTTGSSPGGNVPSGMSVPSAKLNTNANILAACINTAGGVAGDGSPCGKLFSATTPAGTSTPSDTFVAALRLTDFPTSNVSDLFSLSGGIAPFQPSLSTAPHDFGVALSVTSGLSLSGSTIEFGSSIIGAAAQSQSLTLTNLSGADITLSSLALTGTYSADFSFTNLCPGTLQASSSCQVQLQFTPSAAGRRMAAIAIGNSGAISPMLVSLSGIGTGSSAPMLSSFAPNPLIAGAPDTLVTLSGANFNAGSVVYLSNFAVATSFVSSQTLSFVLPTSYYGGGTYPVFVRNSTVNSNTLQIPVNYATPILGAISPGAVIAGSPTFNLKLSGSNFVSNSTVQFNGSLHSSSYNSATSINVQVTAADLATPGTINVSVTNPTPGGGTSANQALQVITAPNRFRTLGYATNDVIYDPVHQLVYASVSSSSTSSPNSIIAVDPAQGTVVGTLPLNATPSRLALSDDASFLYTSLSTSEILRVKVPTLTSDIRWTLSPTGVAGDLAVAPGLPHTVAVSVTGSAPSSRTISIFDDGVPRPLHPAVSYASYSFDTLAWGADATTLYATVSGMSGGPEFVLNVDANGPTLANNFSGAFGDFLRKLTYDKTTQRLYDGYGNVVTPSTGVRAGQFAIHNTLVYEQSVVTVDATNHRAFILNTNYFSSANPSQTQDIQSFDLGNFNFVNVLSVPGLSGSAMARWGNSGLVVGGGSQLFLIDGTFVSSTGSTSNSGGYTAVSPTITNVSPAVVSAGSPSTDVVVTGKDFTAASVAQWNNLTLSLSYQSPTQVTVTLPASSLANAATANLSITNGSATESSNAVPFTVLPNLGPNTELQGLSVSGQEMAWDATRGLLYVAVTDPAAINGGSIVAVDPALAAIKTVVPTGSRPYTLGLSDDGVYLYTGFSTLASVNRYKLSDFSLDLTIPLNGPTNASYAGDVKVAPGHNQTIAVSMGSNASEPRDAGGISIFDNAVPRPNRLAFVYPDTYKFAWGKDATRIFAHTDPVFQGQSYSILSVDGTGVSGRLVTGIGVPNISLRPHYDAGTDLFYSDGGRISDPLTGNIAGSLGTGTTFVVPDSALNRGYSLHYAATSYNSYVLDVYDLRRQTLLKTIAIGPLAGYPTHMLRWGTQGIAILTDGPGMLYLLQGSDILAGATSVQLAPISLSPANLPVATAPGTSLTVTGSNFVPSSTVYVNGMPRATTYISATQLSFAVTAADTTTAQFLGVVVSTPGAGNTSASVLEIDNPMPTAASLSITTITVGTSSPTVTVNGSGFLPAGVVRVNGIVHTSTFISSSSLTVALTSSDLATVGSLVITVTNPAPGGGVSAPLSLQVTNPVPVITSVSPSSVSTGASTQQVFILGSGFNSSTVVRANGNLVPATPSGTSISASLPSSFFAQSGTVTLQVSNPAPGGGSAIASLVVNDGLPSISSLSPTTVTAGTTTPTTVTVIGSGFTASSVATVLGQSRTTTYISPTQLTFQLLAADKASVTTKFINVINPASNGGASNYLTIAVVAAAANPTLTIVNPTQFTVNAGTSYITVGGTGFASSSVIQWNGVPLQSTAYPSSNYIIASVPANLLATVGTASITVSSPTALTPVSNALTVSIVNPAVPSLSSLSPTNGPINTSFTVSLTGANFAAGSVVSINGHALATTFSNSGSLSAVVPASEVVPGNSYFTVTTPAPGGGTSTALSYTAYIPQANNGAVYNPVTGLFYLSVPGSAGAPYGNSIVPLDPVTGNLGTPIPLGSEPDRMSLTSDGRYMWVALDGAWAVAKLDLVTGQSVFQFSLPGLGASLTTQIIYSLVAVPGQTDSVAVLTPGAFGNSLALYDHGVARGAVLSTSAVTLDIDGTRNEMYGASGSTYQVFPYSASGITANTAVTASGSLSVAAIPRIQVSGGRTYGDTGLVLDSETGTKVGSVTASTTTSFTTTIDTALGRIYSLDSPSTYASYPTRIEAFNLSDLSPASTDSVPLNMPSYNTLYVSGLTRWGNNGIAFRSSSNIYVLKSNVVEDLSTSSADVSVSIPASSSAATGSTTTYTARVSNNGPSTATEVRFSALSPSTGNITAASASAGACAVLSGVATCDLGSLANGTSAAITLTVVQLSAGNSTVTVQASASQADPDLTNNQASFSATITGPANSPLATLSSMAPASVRAGSNDTSLTVTGTGFVIGSSVLLDGSPLPTTVTSSTQMTAVVPASALAGLGWHTINAANPAPGGGSSTPLVLSVYSVIKASANRMTYDPYSRKLIATVGPSAPQGNSLAFITPETGAQDTPVVIGSQPRGLALSDDGQILYVTLAGTSRIQRFNMLTQQPEFFLSVPVGYSGDGSGYEAVVMPGTENTIALKSGGLGDTLKIADFDPVARIASVRPKTSGYSSLGSPQFLNSSNLLVSYSSGIIDYAVTSTGLGSYNPATYTGVPNANSFKLAGTLAFTTNGGVADFSAIPGKALGTFPGFQNASSTTGAVAPDPAIHRAFFLTGQTGLTGYDTTTFLPASFVPMDIATIDGTVTNFGTVDVVRWGQDGVAALTTAGNIYLVRGPAVLPQLLTNQGVPSIDTGTPITLQHGSGNQVLPLTGSGFLPGVAVLWNGQYRSTTYIDATHLTLALPASDLMSSGTASVSAQNAGSATGAAATVIIR